MVQIDHFRTYYNIFPEKIWKNDEKIQYLFTISKKKWYNDGGGKENEKTQFV